MNNFERNRVIELGMKTTAESRIKSMIDDDGGEHSLQFSMFIQNTFDKIREHLKHDETAPPFYVPYQQSAYIISSMLIPCIFEPVQLRDLVRDKTYSLMTELKWDIDLSNGYCMPNARKATTLDESRDKLLNSTVNEHNKFLATIYNLISNYAHLNDMVWLKEIILSDGVVVDNHFIKCMDHFFIANANYMQATEDEYLESVMPMIKEYVSIMEYLIASRDYDIITNRSGLNKSITKTDRLVGTHTLEQIIRTIRINGNFLKDFDMFHESIKEEWFLRYICSIIDRLDIVEVVSRDEYDTDGSVVVGTHETVKLLQSHAKKIAAIRPKAKPIIIRPRDWEVIVDAEGREKLVGGFHNLDVPLIPAMKRGHLFPEPEYLRALNKIQGTGYQINKVMFDAVSRMDYLIKVPKKRPTDMTAVRFKRQNNAIKAKNRDASKIMEIAAEYLNEPDIFFVNYADFRGRDYYRQEYLSPQGRDLSKALLNFNRGYKVTTKEAIRWMRINLANLAGQDGLNYNDRVAWVKSNTKKIRVLVNNPKLSAKLMQDADKPWQFLAACFDYVAWMDDPDNYESKLPNGMDGKCNGTQHWCAMLRDEVGGAKVALTPSNDPSDLYSEVLANLWKRIKVYHKKTDDGTEIKIQFANDWVDKSSYESSGVVKFDYLINRKLAKNPTMTSTYSAGKKAFMGYVSNFCIDKGVEFYDDVKMNRKCIGFMVSEIIRAIDDTVSAKSGMTFVQDCVDGMEEVHYRTSLGFHMYMRPLVEFKREFSVKVDGRIRRVTFTYTGKNTNNLALKTGIAPNFIHSNDATHMLKTVLLCPRITHWMMIHDQFSCHHAFVGEMQTGIRKSFVDMYNADRDYGEVKDALLDFKEQMGENANGVKLPEYGNLKVTEVLESDYFFS